MNKPVYVTIPITSVNDYSVDYEVISTYTEIYSSIVWESENNVNYQPSPVKVPVCAVSSKTYVLMRLKRTQEILYGSVK